MRTKVTPADLSKSVMAVPPLARSADGAYDVAGNAALIQHLENGGVSTLLYGGNALAHHWPISQYANWLDRLEQSCGADTWLLPSVGSDGGRLVDQAAQLKSRKFPVALLLPMITPRTEEGTMAALRRFYAECGVQLVVYIKTDNYILPQSLGELVADGVVFGVKYAVPRPQGGRDTYLDAIIAAIGAERIISGFGEPPAIPHMRDYGLAGFTAGCVCLAPAISMAALGALREGRAEQAQSLIQPMLALEAARNRINEIRVLHDAVSLAGIAQMGPILEPSSGLTPTERAEVETAARALVAAEHAFRAQSAA